MNRKSIKHFHHGKEVWLDPNSKAYELHKEKKMDELSKHLDLLKW